MSILGSARAALARVAGMFSGRGPVADNDDRLAKQIDRKEVPGRGDLVFPADEIPCFAEDAVYFLIVELLRRVTPSRKRLRLFERKSGSGIKARFENCRHH